MKKFIRLLKASSLFIILLLMAFGFVQCDSFFNEKEERFDPREHPLIEKGDTLVFIGSEHVDSFYVIESEFYLPHMREGDTQADYEQYCGEMVKIHCVDTCIRLEIVIISKIYLIYYSLPFSINISDPQYSSVLINKSNNGYSLQIGEIILKDLHKFNFRKIVNREQITMFSEIDSAYYSKTYGFVKYIKFTGEEFVLSEECLEMLMERE